MDIVHDEYMKAANRNNERFYRLSYYMSSLAFAFGVVIEWRGVKRLFQKKIHPNWWLFPVSIALAVLSFIPRVYWLNWFGVTKPFYIDMFMFLERNLLLTVLAGILFIRSLTYYDS